MARYKKYVKPFQMIEGAKKSEDLQAKKAKKIDLSKPLPLKNEPLTKEKERLIKNAIVLQQRARARLVSRNAPLEEILRKHNEIMRKKSLTKIMDIFYLISHL